MSHNAQLQYTSMSHNVHLILQPYIFQIEGNAQKLKNLQYSLKFRMTGTHSVLNCIRMSVIYLVPKHTLM